MASKASAVAGPPPPLPPGVSKEVLKEASEENFRRPGHGDKVVVTYKGCLEDANGEKFDSSEGKDPATFTLGEGQVIKGWEAGIPTMRVGEVCRLTISPEHAYGEKGMMPKIPPNATLVFDVELLSFECKDNLFGDWACIRNVINDGEGWGHLQDGSEVEISIRAEAQDGRTLEERQQVAYRLGSGQLGTLSKASDAALKDMKKGGKVELRCQPEYAYGNASHGEVKVRIELHEIYEEEDVSPQKDKSVIKKQTREGNGQDCPRDTCIVKLTVEAVRGSNGALVACFDGHRVVEFRSGDGEVCDALEVAARQMVEGERAVITCTKPEMCVDPSLSLTADVSAAGEQVSFIVELIGLENPKTAYEMSEEEKLAFVTERKEVGSKLFRSQRFFLASERYKGVIEFLAHCESFSDEGKAQAKALKMTCELNLAQCMLKFGDYFGAKVSCDTVLAQEPNNVKALFRRASAQIQRRDFADALEDLKRVLELEPDNGEARRLLPQAQRGAKEGERKARSMYAKMSKVLGKPEKDDVAASSSFVEFAFEAKPDEFSALFLGKPANNTASTNAGDYRLYVGGGAINWAFGELLKKQQGLKFGKISEEYQTLHAELLKASREDAKKLVSARDVAGAAKLLPQLQLAASFGRAAQVQPEELPQSANYDSSAKRFGGAIGSVFIDVFKENSRPLHDRNVAMLYVVGPKGEDCSGPCGQGTGPLFAKERFLKAVEQLGTTAVEMVSEYNEMQRSAAETERLPLIEEVRWCLVSGGVYRHDGVSKAQVAKATIRGMKSAQGSGKLVVTFSYDEDCFKEAWDEEKDGVRQPWPKSTADSP